MREGREGREGPREGGFRASSALCTLHSALCSVVDTHSVHTQCTHRSFRLLDIAAAHHLRLDNGGRNHGRLHRRFHHRRLWRRRRRKRKRRQRKEEEEKKIENRGGQDEEGEGGGKEFSFKK